VKVVVTGAGGFVGSRVVQNLINNPDVSDVTAMDVTDFNAPEHAKLTSHVGDLLDADFRRKILDGSDAVIHLASILGGAAESNYDLARKVNVDATLDLFEDIRDRAPTTRVVFASSIAVFSAPFDDPATDSTPTDAEMVYGGQKLMMEAALANFTKRGWMDGIALRPSGVTARDGADLRLRSAFLSHVFYAIRSGEDIVLPVDPESRIWMTSVECVAWNFMHGVFATDIGRLRAMTLPALSVHFHELVAALHRKFPDSASKVTYEPNPELIALFGSYPALETAEADRLGFRRDADADELVARSFS